MHCDKASLVFFQNQGNLDFFLENNMVDPNKFDLFLVQVSIWINSQPYEENEYKDDGITRFLYIGRIMKDKGIQKNT